MPSAPEFGTLFEKLLTPILGKSPTGPDLREATERGSFDKLQAVIKEDRRHQDKAGHEGTPANWQDVLQKASDLLQNESKDLEVAVWLVRALAKTAGFAGLRDGLALLQELHVRFGDGLHPQDAEVRVSRLEWLDKQLESDLRDALPKEEALPRDQVSQLDGFVQAGTAAVASTVAALKSRYGDSTPTFSGIRRTIDLLAGRVAEAGGGQPGTASTAAEKDSGGGAARAIQSRSDVRSREDALRMMELAAAYFAANEPHSPVPHLLRRAVRWARGSLQQWLNEMVGRDDLLEDIYKTLDMSKPETKQ